MHIQTNITLNLISDIFGYLSSIYVSHPDRAYANDCYCFAFLTMLFSLPYRQQDLRRVRTVRVRTAPRASTSVGAALSVCA